MGTPTDVELIGLLVTTTTFRFETLCSITSLTFFFRFKIWGAVGALFMVENFFEVFLRGLKLCVKIPGLVLLVGWIKRASVN